MPQRDRLEQLAESFVERYRRGERPSLSELAEQNPELADDILTLFPTLVMMEDHAPVPIDNKLPIQTLGEYKIVREIGRGGMGVVYEALQENLGRHVAIKLLPQHAVSDPRHLERFQREARTAAQLHHSNIVPVFGVGEDAGVHYYAMQFIRGRALDEVIHELREAALTEHSDTGRILPARIDSTVAANIDRSGKSCRSESTTASATRGFYRRVAEIGIHAAEGLEYAHQHGFLHRDIKPSNLLLDDQGTIWVTDFGLAKGEESENLTHTGDVVGTLRYVAPERFSGSADARSDIYSLGLTLYELLTLRPAFDHQDRKELIKQITHDEPPPPRRLDRRVPRDLETVILKAIASSPANRYQSALDLANDLRRFCEDRSIEARRASALERTLRWCRRNPIVAIQAAVLALVILVSFIAVAWQWWRAERHLTAAVRLKDQAALNLLDSQRHQARAEENLAHAHDVVEDFFTTIGNERLLQVPGLQPLRRRLLEQAVTYYEDFVARGDDRPWMKLQLAKAFQRLALIRADTGPRLRAVDDLANSLEILGTLEDETEKQKERRLLTAVCKSNLANLSIKLERPDAAGVVHDALRYVRQHSESRDNGAAWDRLLAMNLKSLADLQLQQRQFDKAAANFTDALEIMDRLTASRSGDVILHLEQFELCHTFCGLETRQGRLPEATRLSEKAAGIQRTLIRQFPRAPAVRRMTGRTLGRTAALQARQGQLKQALASLGQAIAVQKQLVQENPIVTIYRLDVVNSSLSAGNLCRTMNSPEDAVRHFQTARSYAEVLHPQDAATLEQRRRMASIHRALGATHDSVGRWKKAIESMQSALAEWRAMAGARPAERYEYELSNALAELARIYRRAQQPKLARPAYEEALSLQRRFPLDEKTTRYDYRRSLATTERGLAMLDYDGGHHQAALTHFEKAESVFGSQIDRREGSSADLDWLASTVYMKGLALRKTNRFQQAEECMNQAIGLRRLLLRRLPSHRGFRDSLDRYLRHLAAVQLDQRKLGAVVSTSRRRVELRKGEPEKLFDVARDLANIARLAAGSPKLAGQSEPIAECGLAAIEALEQAFAAGFQDAARLKSDKAFEKLRSHPRVIPLLQRPE